MQHAYGGNVTNGRWVSVGRVVPRELTLEAVICGNSIELICCEGEDVLYSLAFLLSEWPLESESQQQIFLENRYPLSRLARIIGSKEFAGRALSIQVSLVNRAREKLIHLMGLF